MSYRIYTTKILNEKYNTWLLKLTVTINYLFIVYLKFKYVNTIAY